jgi:hypothetical protein
MKQNFAVLFALLSFVSNAQPHNIDSTFFNQAVATSIRIYEQSLNRQSLLYNGSEYVEAESTDDTHPFLESSDWVEGTLKYDGQRFENAPLLYDIYSGKIVTELHNGTSVALIPEKVKAFWIHTRHFIRAGDSKVSAENGLRPGFYQVIYPGKTMVLAHHKKEIVEKIESTTIHKTFREKEDYYILVQGTFLSANSKQAVLNILSDKKSELKKFINQQKLKFKLNRKQLLSSVCAQYDQLKNQ